MAEFCKRIPAVNAVDGFNPADFTRTLSAEDGTVSQYLDVKYRLLWFRLHRPNGRIESEIVHLDDKSAVVCCKLYEDKNSGDGEYLSKAYAQRFLTQEKFGDRYLETAETAAIGRALAAAGYGTQFCDAGDMLSGIIVDAPVGFPGTEDEPVCTEAQTCALSPLPAVTHGSGAESVSLPFPSSHKGGATLEDYLSSMTVEDAKSVQISFGKYAGSTLGEIALHQPQDLNWYVKFYRGNDFALKAGAMILTEAAMSKAG